MAIELCKHYLTTGFPDFEPMCLLNHKASLKCHSKREDCSDYRPSIEGHYPNKKDYCVPNEPLYPSKD